MPGRTVGETVAAANTTVSPYRTVTAPPACSASLPVSKTNGFALICAWERVADMNFSGCRYEKTPVSWGRPPKRPSSPSQPESPDDLLVPLRAPPVEVSEQPAALSDHREKPAPTRVVVAGGP